MRSRMLPVVAVSSMLATAVGAALLLGTPAPRAAATEHSAGSLAAGTGPAAVSVLATSTPTTSTPTIPELMKIPPKQCTQLVVCAGRTLGSRHGTLYLFEKRDGHWVQTLKAVTRYGSNGLTDGATRVAGNRTTPTGIWRMGAFAFGHHASAPSGSIEPWRPITRYSYWSSVHDATYNTWVRSTRPIAGEHLSAIGVQYEYAISSGFNAPPNKVHWGRGTAIFLHCFGPNGAFTAGCVAMDRLDMVRLLRMLDPAKGPCIVIGTEQLGTPTSLYSY